MFLLTWIISTVCAISNNIQALPELYVLAEDEFYTINLDEYFFGNNLNYEVYPETNVLLSKSYSNFSYIEWKGGVMEEPIRTSPIQVFLEFDGSNQIVLYKSSKELKLLYINLELLLVLNKSTAIFTCVYNTQFYSNDSTFGLFVLADNPDTNIYFFTIESLLNLTNIILLTSLCNITNPYLGQGNINETLLITGYMDDFPVAEFYNISDINNTSLIRTVYLGNQSENKGTIFAVSVLNQHYLILNNDSKLLNFQINHFGELSLVNILELPYFENTTDFQVNLKTNFLMIGFVGGFIMCSYDFQQVFVENDKQIFQEVFMTSTIYNDYVLTRKNHIYFLYKLGQNFNMIGNVTLGQLDYKINWGVLSYYAQNSIFISNNKMLNLELYNITFNYPKLTFTSSSNETDYALIVSQPSDLLSLNYSFTVRKPLNNTVGIIEAYSDSPIKVFFSDFSSQFYVPVQSYVIGSNLSIYYCDIFFSKYQYFFSNSLRIIPNIQHSKGLYIGQNEYEHIETDGKEFIFYNSSMISVYNSSGLAFRIIMSNMTIKYVAICGKLNVFYYENETAYIIGYFKSKWTAYHKFNLLYKCLSITCTNRYVACLCSEGVYALEILFGHIAYAELINNNELTSNISSVSLLKQSFMCMLLKNNQVMITDLDTPNIFDHKIAGSSMTLFFQGAKILSYQNLFISDLINNVYMFDYTFTYIKKFKVLEGGGLTLYNQYLISFTNNQILIIDTNQWVTNSTIANLTLTDWESFTLSSDMDNPLSIYFLNKSQIEIYQIPQNYNQIEVNVEINDFYYNISNIEYDSYLVCWIRNQINWYHLEILLELFVDGETIYKDDKAIEMVQMENMKYQCGDVFNLPLSQIFSGQDLYASMTKAKYVSLEQRFTKKYDLNDDTTCDTYCYSYNQQLYIGVKECNVIVFNSNLTELASEAIENYLEFTCNCYSISILLDYSDTYFVIGCTINRIFFTDMFKTEQLRYSLYFGSFNQQIQIFETLNIAFPSKKLKTYSLNGGMFIVLSAENYDSVSNQEFYSNHLTLTYGEIVNNSIALFDHKCDFSKSFKLNYYYLTDFDAEFDPLFRKFYIYSLDIYFGLRIFEFNGHICIPVNNFIFSKTNPAYTLSKCGFQLFVGMKNTDIRIYNLLNTSSLEYSNTIFAYTSIYTAVQGSLRCSSEFSPNYLFLQMNNSNNFALHIIDLFSGNSSNILSDFILNNSFDDPPKLAEFINQNGDLAIINNYTKSIFQLSSFNLLIDTTVDCNEDLKESFNITVSNTKSKPVSANFTISIKESYEQAKIQTDSIQLWLLVVICIVAFFSALLIYFMIRKCSRRSKIDTSLLLFNYQREFNIITKEAGKLD